MAINSNIVIIDYGLGNLFNVQRAIEALGNRSVVISDSQKEIIEADKIILPGVGAFKDGMNGLRQQGLVETISEFADSGRSVLGICLGMQLFMTESEEQGIHKGLNLIKGKVVRFREPDESGYGYKIPHIGWNSLKVPYSSDNLQSDISDAWADTFLNELNSKPFMYFVHSYIVVVDNSADCIATTDYGRDEFCSVVMKDNISGCQFHPERSGPAGLSILKNFILK